MSSTATSTPKPSETEVSLPRRRTFTGEYRAAILAECDETSAPGIIGAILRPLLEVKAPWAGSAGTSSGGRRARPARR